MTFRLGLFLSFFFLLRDFLILVLTESQSQLQKQLTFYLEGEEVSNPNHTMIESSIIVK